MHKTIMLAALAALSHISQADSAPQTGSQSGRELNDAARSSMVELHTGHQALGNLPEWRCGKDHDKKRCPSSLCCSQAGFCGATEEYCSVPGNCQSKYGWCDSDLVPQGADLRQGNRPYDKSMPAIIDKCTKPKTMALSFDDGPSEHTEEILDILKEHDARATFFLSGIINGHQELDLHWRRLMHRITNEGHQIASHTWSHPNLDTLKSKDRKEEMYKTERAIANVLGMVPRFMRAPKIKCNKDCQKDMKDLAYHIVTWQYDSEDWRGLGAEQQLANLTRAMDSTPEDGNMLIIQHDLGSNGNVTDVLNGLLWHMESTKAWVAVPIIECLGHPVEEAMRAV